jgi:hypothetical protein
MVKGVGILRFRGARRVEWLGRGVGKAQRQMVPEPRGTG